MRRKWHKKRSENEVELAFAENLIALNDEGEDVAQRLLVQSALKSLSTMQRAVVVLHYQYGLSLNEISKTLEIPIGTAASHLARGRALVAVYTEWLPAIGKSETKSLKARNILELGNGEESPE
jgi:RNA polymerase sigma factor (sigma-70 family)